MASGCDNVTWGGMDVRLEGPPPRPDGTAEPAAVAEDSTEASLPDLPAGPLLLAGSRSGARGTLVLVGEVRNDAIATLASEADAPGVRGRITEELLAPGTELVLFSEGVRVGRLIADETALDESFCVPRPTVSGIIELIPSAGGANRFLALPPEATSSRGHEPFQTFSHTYDQRVASLSLAGEALPRIGAPWPPSLLESRQDIQAFQMPDGTPWIAATFLFQDRLEVVAPLPRAYSLILLGSESEGRYRARYIGYRPADSDGKGSPRFFDHLDWDGDGLDEVLLDVFGAESRWFSGLAQRSGTWVETFQDPCGTPSAVTGG